MNKLFTIIFLAIITTIFTSCSKVYLEYPKLETSKEKTERAIYVAVDQVYDARGNHSLDGIFKTLPLISFQSYLIKELNRSPQILLAVPTTFGAITDSAKIDKSKIRYLVKIQCKEFLARVPNSGGIVAGQVAVGAAFGGIGNAIYDAQETEVQGVGNFNYTLVDYNTKKVVFNKNIVDSGSIKSPINECGSRQAKSEAIGSAFKSIILDILYDIEDRVQNTN